MEFNKQRADENIEILKNELDAFMTDEEALSILKQTYIFINIGRKNGKLRTYIALYKAYKALEDKIKEKGGNNMCNAIEEVLNMENRDKDPERPLIICNECGNPFPRKSADGKPVGAGFELEGGGVYYVCESCFDKWLAGGGSLSVDKMHK